MTLPGHKTRIVCTIGPSSDSAAVLEEMICSGMNVARLNFSHGDLAYHGELIESIRSAAAATGRRVAILADLPGPKIRVGKFAKEPVGLRAGQRVALTARRMVGDEHRISVDFDRLPRSLHPGDTVFMNDGYIQLRVHAIRGDDVQCQVMVGGELHSGNGVNLPGIDLGTAAFTERDRDCLEFALRRGVDAVSQSFVETAGDIHDLRRAASTLGYQPFVIAKIERRGALEVIDEIIEAADGMMIARGDLGVEVPIAQIAMVQKELIRSANRRAKPVITATQMLESMAGNPRPTRAEATDVANAILDGTDCVMLSAESAVGKYPAKAVATLAEIAAATEPRRHRPAVWELCPSAESGETPDPAELMTLAVEATLRYSSPAAVFVPSTTGAMVRGIARFRPPVWLVAVSPEEKCCQDLQFSCGVEPVKLAEIPQDWEAFIRDCLRERRLQGTTALLISGHSGDRPGAAPRLQILALDRRP